MDTVHYGHWPSAIRILFDINNDENEGNIKLP